MKDYLNGPSFGGHLNFQGTTSTIPVIHCFSWASRVSSNAYGTFPQLAGGDPEQTTVTGVTLSLAPYIKSLISWAIWRTPVAMWNGQRLDSYKMPWAQRPGWAKDVPSPLLHMSNLPLVAIFRPLPHESLHSMREEPERTVKKQNVTQWCPVVHFNVIMTKLICVTLTYPEVGAPNNIGVFVAYASFSSVAPCDCKHARALWGLLSGTVKVLGFACLVTPCDRSKTLRNSF